MREYWSETARVISWYWNWVCEAAIISLRRSTLLPFAPTGVCVGSTWALRPVSRPETTASRREDSKSTLAARKPGVSTLATLSAMTWLRSDSPSRAVDSTESTEPGPPLRPPRAGTDTKSLHYGEWTPVRRRGMRASVLSLLVGRRATDLRTS